jgi:hypothetical protein
MVYSTLIITDTSFFITDDRILYAQRNYEFHSNIIIIIIIIIELVGVNSKIVRFCKLSMEKWRQAFF